MQILCRWKWNENKLTIRDNLAGWLNTKIADVPREGEIQAMLYNPDTDVFSKLTSLNMEMHNLKERVTIGSFLNGSPRGLVWQWRERRDADGFIYGMVNRKGQLTGKDITFVYQDFLTGLTGTFVNGFLKHVKAVNIVGHQRAKI